MEEEANLKVNYLWNDAIAHEDSYKDKEFCEFLNKAKENMATISLNRNTSTISENNNADNEFTKFLGGLRKELSERSGISKSALSLSLLNVSSCKSAKSPRASPVLQLYHDSLDIDENRNSSLDIDENRSSILDMDEKRSSTLDIDDKRSSTLDIDDKRSSTLDVDHERSSTLDIEEKRSSSLHILVKIENKLKKDFVGNRDVGSKKLYKVFNKKIFDSQLPEDMELEWSVDLRTTAGKTCAVKKGGSYVSCKIILSTKILTTFERLRDTLLHEMCHAAVFLISQVSGESHGPLWKTWAFRCNLVFPHIEIPQRCHSYDLSYPYYYRCNKCEWKCGRYRKLKTLSQVCCPKCKSSIHLCV